MKYARAFLAAIVSDWIGRMSGGGGLLLTIFSFFSPPALQPPAFLVLGVLCLFYASYRAWLSEYKRGEELFRRLDFGSLEITILPVESNFSTSPTPFDALVNSGLISRLGKEKKRRYYKIGLKNESESKTIRDIRADLIGVESLEPDSDTIPLHLQSKNLLSDLKSHFPLRLCFSDNRNPPYGNPVNLNAAAQAAVDVIRWEYDGQHQPTFFLCHIKENVSGELPLGKYQLIVRITADGVPGQVKKTVIGKQGQEFKLWFQEENIDGN